MIDFYFGLPRCGKTTYLVKLALKESRLIKKGKSRYKRILTNFGTVNIPFCYQIPFSAIGKYDVADSLIIIDESSIECDNRDWKNLSKDFINFMMLHGHYNTRFVFASQSYNGYDKKLRSITDNVYYITKKGVFGLWFSRVLRIPYGIIIPDKKDNAGSKFGEICEGYCKPSFFLRLFAPRIFRPRYYRYFDSYSRPMALKPLRLLIGDTTTPI